MALFNKDWNTYKTNWQKGFSQSGFTGGVKSIFQSSNSSSVISNDQVQILRNWNNAVKHGCTNQATFNRIIANADENTKMYFAGLNKGKASMEGLKNAQNVAKTSTIGLTIAQTALNMAISMGLMAAISLAIKGFDKLVNSAKRASEAADEAFAETNDKVQEYDDELKSLDELIAKYKELKESGNLDLEGRKEIKEIQNDIADLVGTQAKNLDLVNGKLDDEIKKLDEISAKEAKRAYETATANYNNSQKANEEAVGDDSFLFLDGYAYTGKREKEAENILKEAGFGENVRSGGFSGNTLSVMDSFDNDMKELKGAQEKADYLQSMIDVLEQNGQRATDLYAGLIKQRDDYLAYIDNQQGAANSLVNSWLTYSQFSNEELSKINVDSVESFETYRQKMIDEAKKDESIGKVLADGTLSNEDLENAINDFMATSLNFSTWYEQWINNVQGSTSDNEITVSFLDTLNSTENAKVKKELLELAKSGEITPETLKTTEDYAELLSQTSTSAESATKQILDMLSAQEKLSGISQGLDKLKSAYEEFKDKDIGFVTAETLESLPDSFKNLPEFDLFSKIVGDPARVNEMQEAFDDLVSAYIRDQRLFTDITNASETEINSIIANLEQMGVTNAKEVVNTAKTEYEKATKLIKDAEEEYANYLNNKDGFNEEFINSTLSKNGKMIDLLSDEYQTDYDNWCELLKKKSEALNEFINAIKSSGLYGDTDSVLSNYSTRTDEEAYKTAKKILDEYNQSKFNNSGLLGSFGNTDFSLRNDDLLNKDVIENARKTVAAYESAQKLSEKLSFNLSNVSVDFSSVLDFEPPSDKDKKDKDPEDYDWVETLLDNTSDALDKVKDKVNDTYSTWESRNKSLQKAIADTQNAINLQAQAEQKYLAKANSIALPEYLKDRVRLGDMSIQDNVDENTSKLINEYKEWYDKAKACRDAQDELNNSLNELKSTQFFELINNEYDALYAKLDNSLDVLQSKIDKAELQGLFANESYYTSMIGYTQAKINNLEKERKQLQNVLNSSGIQNDTEAWSEMYQTLMDTDSEIRDLENQIIEFNNNIRDLDWEIFDYLEDSISRITDETEYLNNLIKESDLFDDKGDFTEYADASIGLHASAYDTQMQMAQDYYEEVQELQTQLLNGAGKDVLERYNEVAEAHRNSVLAAKNEQKSIIELVEKGYQKKIDIMNELIQKTNEAYDSERSLFEYSKSIEEKTKNISSLQKQLVNLQGDDSEENQSRIQTLKVELEKAQQDLEETQMDRNIEEREKLLDSLATEYEEFLNARLDDEDALLKEIVSGISDKGDKINDTLQTLAKENGTFISDTITSIFDADSPFTSELSGIKTNTAGTTNAINTLINTVAGIVGTNNNGNAGSNGSNVGNTFSPSKDTSKSPSTPSVNNTPSNNNANKNASSNTSKGEYDNIFIHKKYSPQKLNRETSLVDRLKSDNIDASWEARSQYWSKIFGGAYTGSESQNIKFLNWLKANGYKNGTLSASKGLHIFDEEGLGSEIIITKEGALRQFNAGDTVISDEGTKRLWQFAQDPEGYMSKLGLSGLNHPQFVLPTPKTPDMSNLVRRDNNNSFNMGDINIEMHEVNDAKGLMDDITNNLIKNRRFENAMCTMINNKIMGKNPTEHYKYIK